VTTFKASGDRNRHECRDPLVEERPGLYVRASGVLVTPFATTRRGLASRDELLVGVLAEAVNRNLDQLPALAWIFPDGRPPAALGAMRTGCVAGVTTIIRCGSSRAAVFGLVRLAASRYVVP
jgi:hypothetical protein